MRIYCIYIAYILPYMFLYSYFLVEITDCWSLPEIPQKTRFETRFLHHEIVSPTVLPETSSNHTNFRCGCGGDCQKVSNSLFWRDRKILIWPFGRF